MFYVCHENAKGELAGKHNKLISESFKVFLLMVLATVYEITFICRTVHLNLIVNC